MTSSPLGAGQEVGRYRILELLGQGGMGTVYRAADSHLERVVALKVLHTDATSEDAWQHCLREARVLARLSHPGIARLLDCERTDSLAYLVLEFVSGRTLRDHLQLGRLPAAECVRIARGIAHVAGHAHAHGVVHRDLKPDNVMLEEGGGVRLLDLGLAGCFEGVLRVDTFPDLTQAPATESVWGRVVGTPAYMAPEQATGAPLSPTLDIWALGCVLFETLSGERCFGGRTASECLRAVREQPPPWSRLPATVAPALRSLLADLLAKDPRDRPSRMEEVLERLGGAERAPRHGSPEPNPFAPPRHNLPPRASRTTEHTLELEDGCANPGSLVVLAGDPQRITSAALDIASRLAPVLEGGAWCVWAHRQITVEVALHEALGLPCGRADDLRDLLGSRLAVRPPTLFWIEASDRSRDEVAKAVAHIRAAAPLASLLVTRTQGLEHPNEVWLSRADELASPLDGLSGLEQRALACLAVHPVDCSTESAEVVLAAAGVESDGASLDVLHSLARQGLCPRSPRDTNRWRLASEVRAAARARLDDEPVRRAIELAHAQHLASRVDQHASRERRADQDFFDLERWNLEIAAGHALAQGHPELAQACAAGAAAGLERWGEGSRADALLHHHGASPLPTNSAHPEDFDELDNALERARACDSMHTEAELLLLRAEWLEQEGQVDAALESLERAAPLLRELGHWSRLARLAVELVRKGAADTASGLTMASAERLLRHAGDADGLAEVRSLRHGV